MHPMVLYSMYGLQMSPVKPHLCTCHFLPWRSAWLGNIRWGTKEKDLTVSPSHTAMHTGIHSGVHTKTHTQPLTLCQINTQYTQGTRILLKHAHVILSLFFFLPLHSFLLSLNVLISVHTYFGALNRVRDGPFSTSRSRRQSNSAWHASLWVTGDADAHFRETS